MITQADKNKLFDLIHDLLEAQSFINNADTWEMEAAGKAFDESEEKLINFINTIQGGYMNEEVVILGSKSDWFYGGISGCFEDEHPDF